MPDPTSPEQARRPIIGITCYEEVAAWGNWKTVAAVLPVSYVRAIERAGAIPVLLPPQNLSPLEAAEVIGRLDGLVVAGGNDVHPTRYGADSHERTVVAGGERDDLELVTIEAAVDEGVPTLAICRGLQVLNVSRGGTLEQHLPDVVGHERHSPTPGGFGEHDVHVEPGTKLASLLSWTSAAVPVNHHQAIGELGRGLVPSAYADDGVIEAVEDTTVPFLVGVQWHPEAGGDPALFVALVAAARERSAAREGLS
ncbi:MAG: gamma-glutamyl-gamma-aminobutyrate hydrolase family protein [Acidimicrobiales bacterium]